MSDKIALRMAEGDLDIEGAGRVEVKAETTKGGGRLGEGVTLIWLRKNITASTKYC